MTDDNEGFYAPTPEGWEGPEPYNAAPVAPPCKHWSSRKMRYNPATNQTDSVCQLCGEWFELLERSP